MERKVVNKAKRKVFKTIRIISSRIQPVGSGIKNGIGYYVLIMFTKFVIFQETFTWKKPIGNLVESILIGLVSAAIIKELAFKRKSAVRKTSELKS